MSGWSLMLEIWKIQILAEDFLSDVLYSEPAQPSDFKIIFAMTGRAGGKIQNR